MLLNKRFTIGEMAKMHNIAESTLRYYDEKEFSSVHCRSSNELSLLYNRSIFTIRYD